MSFQYPESNEENNPSGMPITAPVPLSYATRGKAAYQSILSVGDEDSLVYESQEHVQPTSEHLGPNENMTNSSVLPTDMQLFQWQEDLRRAAANQATQSQQTVQPSMIIRPISASTLIALTEPCLMKWCLDPDSELLSPLPSSSDPVVLPFTFNTGFQADMMPAAAPNTRVVNSWGY
ncbi:hypothetical protein BDN70DRAFT_944382 [Pholiota conissans]|uniref:Uncharacterized protein n=1 Tax=Pholiota conissans TaxID=109636 RepID=A0A9P5YZL7_9AGAR|nr:hypothetical protein BDN70DRAFT_944382 [Pholiota conissans]